MHNACLNDSEWYQDDGFNGPFLAGDVPCVPSSNP